MLPAVSLNLIQMAELMTLFPQVGNFQRLRYQAHNRIHTNVSYNASTFEAPFSSALLVTRASINLSVLLFAREIASVTSNAIYWWSFVGKSSRARHLSTEALMIPTQRLRRGCFLRVLGTGTLVWMRCSKLKPVLVAILRTRFPL